MRTIISLAISIFLYTTSTSLRASEINIVGIWAMHPLNNGIANVTAYDENGISYLYPFECSWEDGKIREEPVIKGTYDVDKDERKIVIIENGRRISLDIVELSNLKMVLLEDGNKWQYYRMTKARPICDLDELNSLISGADLPEN